MKTMIIGAAVATLLSTAAFAEPSSEDWARIHSALQATSMSQSPKTSAAEVMPARLKKAVVRSGRSRSQHYDSTTWTPTRTTGELGPRSAAPHGPGRCDS